MHSLKTTSWRRSGTSKFCKVLTAVVFFAIHGAVFAQVPNLPAGIPPAHISDNSQKVLASLAGLNELPVNCWKMHAGNLGHGETLNLDESDWQAVKPPVDGPTDAVWYRASVEIPASAHGYDLTGSRVWFQLQAKANGPIPEIIYFDGRRVAMGENLEPIVLIDNLKSHQRILIAVKLLATIDSKSFLGGTLRIEFPSSRPSPADLLTEFLTAQQLLPQLSGDLAADTATLERAIQSIDFTALDNRDQAAFDIALQKAQKELEPLRPILRQATFSLSGNAHIDAAWLWPWTEAVDAVKRTFSTALQLMDEYPDYTFTQSSAAYSEWIKDKYPVLNDRIKERVREGRWEIVGGMWVEPDLNMPDGESELRNILLGKRWFQKEYGVKVRIGWNPDSFGYDWQLPQIYKKSGIDYFVTQKMNWNDTNHLPFHLFWWESPDGSKVLTYFPTDYVHLDLNPSRISQDFSVITSRIPGLNETMELYGVGDHGGGPTRAILDEGMHWVHAGTFAPQMKFARAQDFFSDIETKIASASPEWSYRKIAGGYSAPAATLDRQIAIPTWKDELYFEYHRGVMTTQAKHKRGMRESEVEALDAERYAAIAWLHGQSYPADELAADWKAVTFNDFHDLAGGSGVAAIYRDAQQSFEQIRLSTDSITSKSLSLLVDGIDTAPSAPSHNSAAILVFNPLAWDRMEDVEIQVELPHPADFVEALGPRGPITVQVLRHESGSNRFNLLLSTGKVPSLGYSVLHLFGLNAALPSQQKAPPSALRATSTTLENANLRVVVDHATGCITSLIDKRANFNAIAANGCGNQLQVFDDNPTQYDAWNIDRGTLDHATPLNRADSVALVQDGPLRATIRITRTWQRSKFVQDLSLDANSDFVNVANDIDWHETHILLKAAMPLAVSSAFATYEIPYGTIERPTTRNDNWEKAKFEVPALRWADLGDGRHGLSLINDSKYGYDAEGNTLRLSLLRSPVWPDPEADRGHHRFGYALYPHAGSWQQALTIRHGYDYNYPLYAAQVLEHSGAQPADHSFFSIDASNVVLTAVKKAEDRDGLILHLFEWAGKSSNVKIHLPEGAVSGRLTDLMEEPAGSTLPVVDNAIDVSIGPYEIEAIEIDYPQRNIADR